MLKISSNTKVVVIGLGKSGRSAIKFCRGLGAQVLLSEGGQIDDDTVAWLAGQAVDYEDGGHSLEFLCRGDFVLISPGVPHNLPVLQEVRQKGVAVVGELALAAAYLRTPVIAITGTNGKTTVTTLIGDLLRAAGQRVFVGGNIGTPLTDYLAGSQDAQWLVLEVSSFQLDTVADFSADIAILLNISPDHLDRYEGLADYANTKMRLINGQKSGQRAIVNYDDNYLRRQDLGEVLYFGHNHGHNGAIIKDAEIQIGAEIYHLSDTVFAKPPNLENAAAAILAVRTAGCPVEAVKRGLADFRALPHRMTFVEEIAGVCYIDDSKATNIGAVVAALTSLRNDSVILIAGGRDKGGDYGLLAESVGKKVKTMLVIGEAQDKMIMAFKDFSKVEKISSLEGAVKRAAEIAGKGDTVLLSPACASFDMFNSYAERGDVFQQEVAKLAAGGIR